jgi:succinyl-diaminopimelate desuccinylase
MVEEGVPEAVAATVDPAEVLRFARALIAAPSENPGGTEDEAAAVATGILGSFGARTQTIRSDAGRPSVIGVLGTGARPSLAWNGHLDVVPAGARDTWSHGPWDGDVVDGRLIGRGSADMKGPVAAALAAGAAIVRTGIPLAGTLEFHLAADEELAGLHGTKVLWERGLLTPDAAIVGEPSEMHIGLAQRGGAWITLTAYGRAAHGSQPHRGVNAITTMARYLLRLPEVLPDITHPLVGSPTVNAALISGGSAPNVVPDRCVVDVDRRIVPGETDPQQVLAPFRALAAELALEDPDLRVEAELREWTQAAETSPDTHLVRLAGDAVAAETGTRPEWVGFTGITDARYYINQVQVPTMVLGPGSLTVAHTANESVLVDDLVAAARVYARIFVGFLAG